MSAREFFIVANSFAAPIVSDQSTSYITADSPGQALEAFAAAYSHPAGLYAAACYPSADACHKDEESLARWVSFGAIADLAKRPRPTDVLAGTVVVP